MQSKAVQDDKISTINPATGEIIESYEIADMEQITSSVRSARTAYLKWKNKEVIERCDYIRNLAKVLKKNLDQYARIITQ